MVSLPLSDIAKQNAIQKVTFLQKGLIQIWLPNKEYCQVRSCRLYLHANCAKFHACCFCSFCIVRVEYFGQKYLFRLPGNRNTKNLISEKYIIYMSTTHTEMNSPRQLHFVW